MCVALACGNQIDEILVEVFDFCMWLIADVWIDSRWWNTIHIASIRLDSWIGGADNAIHIVDEILLCTSCHLVQLKP